MSARPYSMEKVSHSSSCSSFTVAAATIRVGSSAMVRGGRRENSGSFLRQIEFSSRKPAHSNFSAILFALRSLMSFLWIATYKASFPTVRVALSKLSDSSSTLLRLQQSRAFILSWLNSVARDNGVCCAMVSSLRFKIE